MPVFRNFVIIFGFFYAASRTTLHNSAHSFSTEALIGRLDAQQKVIDSKESRSGLKNVHGINVGKQSLLDDESEMHCNNVTKVFTFVVFPRNVITNN